MFSQIKKTQKTKQQQQESHYWLWLYKCQAEKEWCIKTAIGVIIRDDSVYVQNGVRISQKLHKVKENKYIFMCYEN